MHEPKQPCTVCGSSVEYLLSTICFCKMCGSIFLYSSINPNRYELKKLYTPQYYDFFIKLQEVVAAEDISKDLTQDCVNAIHRFTSSE
jgi:hypothetical protein